MNRNAFECRFSSHILFIRSISCICVHSHCALNTHIVSLFNLHFYLCSSFFWSTSLSDLHSPSPPAPHRFVSILLPFNGMICSHTTTCHCHISTNLIDINVFPALFPNHFSLFGFGFFPPKWMENKSFFLVFHSI